MHRLLITLAILWASPYSLAGLLIGFVGVFTGGGVQRIGRTLEFHGGFTRWFVRHLPLGAATTAITLGHTILGQTAEGLARVREHEWVHVRQFERWGFLMGPAYLLASLVVWLQGRRAYRDNPFEREAYGDQD
ncbi:MAG: hypothetical protein U1A77_21550 [Pirellulales bacterium]